MNSNTPIVGGQKIDIGTVIKIAEQIGLLDILKDALSGLFKRKPTLIPAPSEVTAEPGAAPVVVPIAPAPLPTPTGVPGPNVSRVVLKVQKAEYPNDPGHMYLDPMKLVRDGDNFNFGSVLWLDLTAYDEDGDELMGDDLIAADLDYRTKHVVAKDGGGTYFIEGRGGSPGAPDAWGQSGGDDTGVNFGFRAWKDSIGMNVRATFKGEGVYEAVGYVGGVESNRLTIRVS